MTERDLEVLLLDLIHKSPDFRNLLVQRSTGDAQDHEFAGAWRPLDDAGEGGLVALLRPRGPTELAIFVDVRIIAPLEPRQAFRYRGRGAVGRGDGSWDRFAICLIAPGDYLASRRTIDWDGVIAIEELLGLIAHLPSPPPGILVATLEAAIEKYRDRRNTPQDPKVVAFFAAYAKHCADEYPDLRLHAASLGRAEALENWVQFADGYIQRYPTDVRLCHRPSQGVVEIEITGAKPAEVRLFLEAALPPGASIERAGGSTAIRFGVPAIDQTRPFSGQRDTVAVALARARILLGFWTQHRARLGYGDA
ncbi:MAG TPA: hypothetical protein VHW66_00785 [Stellaceae bacterium]|nr:hypothetical protein [Stellaceae bacterium]